MIDDQSPPQPDRKERWASLASLVDVLLDTPADRRSMRIAELSGGNPSRRAELEALLAECEREPALFARPAADRFAHLLDDDAPHLPNSLAERYEVIAVVSHGEMAVVYRARDRKHDRDVAVKVLRPALGARMSVDRFLREIEIVARLRHPLIVPLYDSGEADGYLYYVMPYESGQSLQQRLARDGPPPIPEAIRILRDLCDALAYAHERGIVHRDIKPANVLLTGDHSVVADFGVARVASTPARLTATTPGLMIGTPAYMAPEQITADQHIDHRADIYAVGVLGYELLTGRLPFQAEQLDALLHAHLLEPPTPISTHRSDVPPALVEWVMRCLEKRPDDRWQSAQELVRRLDALSMTSPRRWRVPAAAATVIVVGIVAAGAWMARGSRPTREALWRASWSNARIERLTDFPGDEVDAAISPDGQFAAFLADRDTVFDAFITQIGTGHFVNLTTGTRSQLFNDDVRNIGFTGDGTHLWLRVGDITSPAKIAVVPTLGGPLRPFHNTAVNTVWSPNGTQLAFHEASPGDPIYIAERDGSNPRRVFSAVPGVHCHYLTWSPDGRFIYFSMGAPPDRLDIWRVSASGGPAERMTTHGSRVAYPVLLDVHTLLYIATADDGTGPWLYSLDVDERVARRMSTGVEQYTSIAASSANTGDTRRLVATVANPTVQLLSVAIGGATMDQAVHIDLPTARAAAPRFETDSSFVYLASRSGADAVWRQTRGVATEVWKPADGAVVGAAATSPDGRTICVPVRRRNRSTLHCMAPDGSNVHTLAESLDVRGTPSWSPDGAWLAVTASDTNGVRVFRVSSSGGAPVRLVDSVSSNPVWSPTGDFILYSGTPRARSVPLKAVTPQGKPYPVPPLVVDRLGDSYRFLPSGKQVVVKLGGFRRQNFWLFDLVTGERRQLTNLPPGDLVHRFDTSPDGKRIMFELVRAHSDIALIELAGR
jgi:serine/threonine protein kinase/WD40 repeat protein